MHKINKLGKKNNIQRLAFLQDCDMLAVSINCLSRGFVAKTRHTNCQVSEILDNMQQVLNNCSKGQ